MLNRPPQILLTAVSKLQASIGGRLARSQPSRMKLGRSTRGCAIFSQTMIVSAGYTTQIITERQQSTDYERSSEWLSEQLDQIAGTMALKQSSGQGAFVGHARQLVEKTELSNSIYRREDVAIRLQLTPN
ncbi:hypothetical protein BDW72DRAFT_180173 [Aspergillus terricola var. indicus]